MKKTQIIMGMPITIEVVDKGAGVADISQVFEYFNQVDQKFSTYKKTSEISAINSGKFNVTESSAEMRKIFSLAEKTKKETNGFFNIERDGKLDPSGIVKGWAILNASKILKKKGFKNFYIDCGGDIQSSGKNKSGKPWRVGIRNPFNVAEIIKVVTPKNKGVATSGTYERCNHIYNPGGKVPNNIVSLTVIGLNVYEADRFATAVFAMGESGINFIENLAGFEGYMVNKEGMATYTSGFEGYVV